MTSSDIMISYVNKTANTDFEVVVFTKNFNINTPKVYYVAWKVLRAQREVDFVYPASMEIGATVSSSGLIVVATGPFPSKLGSTWEFSQDNSFSVLTLKEVKAPINPNGAVVIKNIPKTRGMLDIGVYKNDGLIVVQKDVHVGNEVIFELKPKLYFGVVRNMVEGEVFTSLEMISSLTEFDLNTYPKGIKVTLKQLPGGGQYEFSGEAMS